MQLTGNQIWRHLESFTKIYKDGKEENPMPEGVKLTVYCKATNNEGYVDDIYSNELGIEALIAHSWILHDDLIKLCEAS